MSVSGAGRQATQVPVAGGVVAAIGAVQQLAQKANRNPVALPADRMQGTYLLEVPDTAAVAAGTDSTALTFAGDQALAHGILRADDPTKFFLPCTGCTLAAINVAADHASGYVTFTIEGGAGIPEGFVASPDDGTSPYMLIGNKGAAVTATFEDKRESGDPAVYSGTIFLQPLGTDATN